MFEKNANETFAEYIIRLRKSRGYSQRKLAALMGTSNTTVSRIENGITEKPDADTIKLLAKCLGIEEQYMFKAAGYIENKIHENAPKDSTITLSSKDEKDIEKRMEHMRQELMKSEGLMLSGDPVSPEAVQSILDALEFGMRQAKIINKKFTPKKYRKSSQNNNDNQ